MTNSRRTPQTLGWTSTLLGGLGVHYDIPVSDTQQTVGLRVGFIKSNVTTDKLFPINLRDIMGPPKMSLLLEIKSALALIVRLRFILFVHTDDLSRCITSNQQGQMLIQNFDRIVSRPNVTPRQALQYTTNSIPINLVFQENFPINTQDGTACAIETTSD